MSLTYISTHLRQLVYARAQGCCEYCLVSEDVVLVAHQIDHVIAEKHGGLTIEGNLALACTLCNKRKGSDIASIDPLSQQIVRLFNPRQESWLTHFELQTTQIMPLTPIGRATVQLLQLNHKYKLSERALLLQAHKLLYSSSQ